MKRTGSLMALALLPVMASCTPEVLRPVEPALQSDLSGAEGVATTAGVNMVASTNAWDGNPARLDDLLRPVLIKIENGSDRPLRITYGNFRIESASDEIYAALPPFSIDERDVVSTAMQSPYYGHTGFGIAPHHARYYSGVAPYGTNDIFDRPYYDRYYGRWGTGLYVDLPTEDMLDRAMPEGVIAPGGELGGFVYFEDLKAIEPVEVIMVLVDASTGEEFGVVSVPFVPESPDEASS